MGSALGVEYVFGTATHAGAKGTLIDMLLGAVVAMMGSMAMTGAGGRAGFWVRARTALFFPVAIGIGLLAGVLVNGSTRLMLAVFVVVITIAVAIRRFGQAFFFYGFMGWLGYFFGSFLHATLSMMPSLIEAVAPAGVGHRAAHQAGPRAAAHRPSFQRPCPSGDPGLRGRPRGRR
jgi:hypothetical protein